MKMGVNAGKSGVRCAPRGRPPPFAAVGAAVGAARAAADWSAAPHRPCGDGEETPSTRHRFFMTVSSPFECIII